LDSKTEVEGWSFRLVGTGSSRAEQRRKRPRQSPIFCLVLETTR